MDPLADRYNRLNVKAGEEIEPLVMNKAIIETRRFLIKIAVSAFTLFAVSTLAPHIDL